MNMSFFENPSVWSAAIAFLALILSQLPPLKQLVKGIKIDIAVPEQFMLTHYLGNIHVVVFIGIHNSGGKSVSISKIECIISGIGTDYWVLPAQAYISRHASVQPGQQAPEYPMGWIYLKPGEDWNESVRFFKTFSPFEEEKSNELISEFRKNIMDKHGEQTYPNKRIEADQELVNKAIDFFKKQFTLEKGNFQLHIAALSRSDDVIKVRSFEFTLFESSIRAIQESTDEYKYGSGVYYSSIDPTVSTWPRLRPMDDNRALEEYKKLRKLQ